MIKSLLNKILERKKYRILLFLILSNFFGLGLLTFRMIFTSNLTFIFLIWNIFLAAIPFIISSVYSKYDKHFKSRIILFLTVIVWFPFFPNAPYIITDLFHLWQRNDIPLWFDLILILTFALNGMLFGFLSLYEFQKIIIRRFNAKIGWGFAICALIAGSFGVYIGRYFRWNSWDIIFNPISLARDIVNVFIHPIKNSSVFGMTIFFSCFFIISYAAIQFLYKHINTEYKNAD
ncbi:MAG: DUF1361 domain-containing protein [Bacteroidota bacterium]